jgi:hypothetical protein
MSLFSVYVMTGVLGCYRIGKNLCIVDCRPQKNALGNVAKGGGWEVADNYPNCKIKFLSNLAPQPLHNQQLFVECAWIVVMIDIHNIHAVRSSFQGLRGLFLVLPRPSEHDALPSSSQPSLPQLPSLSSVSTPHTVDALQRQRSAYVPVCIIYHI